MSKESSKREIWLESYGKNVPEGIDFEDITLPEALKRSARKYPSNTALIYQGCRISYAKLDDMVDRLASFFGDLGVRKGDKIAILLPNLIQTVVSFYAALRIGAVSVMDNPLRPEREVERRLNDSGATILVCLDFLAHRMKALRSRTKIREIIFTGIGDYLPFPKNIVYPLMREKKGLKAECLKSDNLYSFVEKLNNYPASPPETGIDLDDAAILHYTGGGRDVPRRAMLTHANLSRNVQMLKVWFPTLEEGGETGIGTLPFFHLLGITCVMNLCIYMGWANILIPTPEAGAILNAVKKYKPTFFTAVPTIYEGLLSHPKIDKYNLSSIKVCLSGSAPLPADAVRRIEEMTGAPVVEGFGPTEASPLTHMNPFMGKRKIGSIGLPLPGTECRIVDIETGKRDVRPGEAGELVVRGPQVTAEYHNMPGETAETLKDGWLYTGYIAVMDEEGYFYVLEGVDKTTVAGADNTYFKEIDDALHAHPKVREAAAVWVPDEKRGETVKVYVVPREGEAITEEEIMKYLSGRLAGYKLPWTVEFRDDLPKSGVGKVLINELRAEEVKRAGS